MDTDNFTKEEQELYDKVQAAREEDPLAGVTMGAKDIFNMIAVSCKNDMNQISIMDFLLYAGGMAGFACQVVPMFNTVVKEGVDIKKVFKIVMTERGDRYWFGEKINKLLYGEEHSIWSYVLSAYRNLCPDKPVPDVTKTVKRAISCMGNTEYKICGKMTADELLTEYAKKWKMIFRKLTIYCPSATEWPILFGMIIEKGFNSVKGIVEPDMVWQYIMEAALFGSKMDIASQKV